MYVLMNILLNRAHEPHSKISFPLEDFTKSTPINIIFSGPKGMGTKTSFINRYVTGTFTENLPKCVNVQEIKTLLVNGIYVQFGLVDVHGTKKPFSALTHFKNVCAVVVGYSITSEKSFNKACSICKTIEQKYPRVMIMVVGGMADKESERQVSADEGRARAKASGAKLFFESITIY